MKDLIEGIDHRAETEPAVVEINREKAEEAQQYENVSQV